jgi:hypothetical protein
MVFCNEGEFNMNNREVVIVAAARTPVGKAKRGSLATVRPDELKMSLLAVPSPKASRD